MRVLSTKHLTRTKHGEMEDAQLFIPQANSDPLTYTARPPYRNDGAALKYTLEK